MVVVLAFFSYKKENPIHLKMQPVLLSFAFGFTFIISYLLHYPLFYILSLKYKSSLPEKFTELLSYPIFVDFLTLASLYMGYSFILHAIATWITVVRLSNWSWIRYLNKRMDRMISLITQARADGVNLDGNVLKQEAAKIFLYS